MIDKDNYLPLSQLESEAKIIDTSTRYMLLLCLGIGILIGCVIQLDSTKSYFPYVAQVIIGTIILIFGVWKLIMERSR